MTGTLVLAVYAIYLAYRNRLMIQRQHLINRVMFAALRPGRTMIRIEKRDKKWLADVLIEFDLHWRLHDDCVEVWTDES